MGNPTKRPVIDFTGYDADGLAMGTGPDGRLIHVPGGISGERAEIEIEHLSPHHPTAWGRIRTLLKPSPHRLSPSDSGGHHCGGCAWSHMDQTAQLAAKEDTLAGIGRHCGFLDEDDGRSPAITPSPKQTGYRNRGKYVIFQRRGKLGLGSYLPRSHKVVSTLECPVMAPAVAQAARALAGVLQEGNWSVYDEGSGRGLLRYAGIRANAREEILVTLVVTGHAVERASTIARKLKERCPNLSGLTLDINPTPGNVIFSGRGLPIWGQQSLSETYGRATIQLTGHGFGQVNREVAGLIYQHVTARALNPLPHSGRGPKRIWDLFSGAGALTQLLALSGAASLKVLGIERNEEAVALARRAAEEAGLSERCQFSAGDANLMLSEKGARLPPEVLVLNPPRTGCRPALLKALESAPIARILYVSCSPETLSRDLRELGRGHYRLMGLQGYDMLPLTPHLEVVAELLRH